MEISNCNGIRLYLARIYCSNKLHAIKYAYACKRCNKYMCQACKIYIILHGAISNTYNCTICSNTYCARHIKMHYMMHQVTANPKYESTDYNRLAYLKYSGVNTIRKNAHYFIDVKVKRPVEIKINKIVIEWIRLPTLIPPGFYSLFNSGISSLRILSISISRNSASNSRAGQQCYY